MAGHWRPAAIGAGRVIKVDITPLRKAARARGRVMRRGRERLPERAPPAPHLFGWRGAAADLRVWEGL